MTIVTLTFGEPGVSDVLLVEVENVAEKLGLTVQGAVSLLIGVGLASLEIDRVTRPGRGLDPTPLSDEEIGRR